MILLFGVAIFSYMMGIFIEILHSYKTLNAELDDGDNLTRFFGLISHFNKKAPMDIELKQKIEAFFDYKWSFDRNQAFDEEEEVAMMQQLPYEVINKIYCNFLFSSFLSTFRETFKIMKPGGQQMTWED